MTKKFIFLLLLMFTGLQIMQAQQTYSIKGIVKDAANGEPVSFANVVIWNTIEGTVTDSIGQFEITGVSPGSYRLQASFIGYKPTVTAEFRISNKDMFFPIELEESSESLQEVSIVAFPQDGRKSARTARDRVQRDREKCRRKPGHIQGRAIFSWCGIYGCFPKRPDGQRRRTV